MGKFIPLSIFALFLAAGGNACESLKYFSLVEKILVRENRIDPLYKAFQNELAAIRAKPADERPALCQQAKKKLDVLTSQSKDHLENMQKAVEPLALIGEDSCKNAVASIGPNAQVRANNAITNTAASCQ